MNWKRFLSVALAFVMLLSLMPTVHAVEGTQLNLPAVNGLLATYGEEKTVDSNGMITSTTSKAEFNWKSSGDRIEVRATGTIMAAGSELTLTNNSGGEATLKFSYDLENPADFHGYVWIEGEKIGASKEGASGNFEKTLAAGESVIITLVSPNYYEACTLVLSNIMLVGTTPADATVTFKPATEGGSYTVDGAPITESTQKTAEANTEYVLEATAAEGYQFFGWFNETKGAYVYYSRSTSLRVDADMTVYPVFIAEELPVFDVGGSRFNDLTEADTYASSQAYKTIVLVNNGTLTGEHTISAGNTLLIPYDDAWTVHTEAATTATQNGNSWVNKAWEKPTAYRTLTMAEGAKITVDGSLNVGGRHSSGPYLTAGTPSGNVGMIQMAGGSNITVGDGGNLYCWGYIYGGGTVTAKNGATVHENFQFTDFRGGNATLNIAQDFVVFPLSQYYVQNIEVAATFEYGATEYVWASLFVQDLVAGTGVKFIGDDPNECMFVPGVNGKVTKTYIPETDRLQIDIDGDGSINPMAVSLSTYHINTATFVLPINSNMTINVNSGMTTVNQSLALLPGSVLNIEQGATLTIAEGEPYRGENGKMIYHTGGHNLIIYDRDQWLNGYLPKFNNGYLIGAEPVENFFVHTQSGNKRLQPIAYSPSWTKDHKARTEADLVDAVVDINGTLITNGYIYTTVDINVVDYFYNNKLTITGGGAAVTSSQGTGKLVMNNGMGKDYITMQPKQTDTEVDYIYLPMVSAQLQNADGSYFETLGARAGASFDCCTICGQWKAGTEMHDQAEISWIIDGRSYTQEFCVGMQLVYLDGTREPEKADYKFIGWSTTANGEILESLPVATIEATYYACFEKEQTAVLGDLDGDGDVDSDDLTLLAQYVSGIIDGYDETLLANGDMNQDGKIDAEDLTRLAQKYVEMYNSSNNA